MEPHSAHKGGLRALVVVLLLVVAARAFLPPAPPLRQQESTRQHQQQHPPRRRMTAKALARQSPSGAGGLSATLPIEAVTRTEALSGFCAALALSTAAVVPPPADRLGVVDDLLADCPSVSEIERQMGLAGCSWSMAYLS